MTWASLDLWADEEQRIHKCLREALERLIKQDVVRAADEENLITRRLEPSMRLVSKEQGLDWTIHFQASSYGDEDDPDPVIHPDLRMSRRDTDHEQYDYDVEAKLIRVKRENASTDYCYNYVKKGVVRYQLGTYAQSKPPMGTVLGYIQEGEIASLIATVNDKAKYQSLNLLELIGAKHPSRNNLKHNLN